MCGDMDRFADEFERLSQEWLQIVHEPDPTSGWDTALAEMAAEVAALRAQGQWRTGLRTLLGSLGLHHNELVMCRGLAWLLTPDAWHGLGPGVLDGLLGRLGLSNQGSPDAVVAVEETVDNTRADIIVRFGATTVLLEAKIWASEQPTQCDRLAFHWADAAPALVYLTRIGAEPTTAIESRGLWHSLAWSDVADLIEQAVIGCDDVDVGVMEYLRTLRIYGGDRA